jgi:chorismate mutase
MVTGIRGAIIAAENTREAVLEATIELLNRVIETNDLTEDTVAAIFFTATTDLNAEFPAMALREIGWRNSAALCAQEIDVPDSMSRVIRILVFANRAERGTPKHQYIGRARELRPDLAGAK